MDLHSLSPTLEQHSLNESCHLAILPSNPKPNPNPNPNADPNLRALSSTAFKREARKKRKERKRQEKLAEKLESLLAFETPTRPPDSASASVVEWPCSEIRSVPNPEPTGWPVPDPNPNPKPTQAPIAPPEPQQNVLKQCQDFLAANDDDDDEDEEEDVGESGNFEFFMGLFEKDGELRGFYEKNWEKGDFCCLVCGAIGEKMGKRYGNCVGLVQHANTVSKTRRRVAHRNFGRAVCRVLGWEIDKLPGVFDGLSVVRDVQAQENIHKQVDTIEEAGPHKGVGGPVGPGKGELIDYMEADPVAD